jgi:hypothetical protein
MVLIIVKSFYTTRKVAKLDVKNINMMVFLRGAKSVNATVSKHALGNKIK